MKKRSWALALALIAILFAFIPGSALVSARYEIVAAALPQSTDRDATVEVTVKGAPREGAIVTVLVTLADQVYMAGRGHTDAKGIATVSDLPRGEVWVLADADGMARASTQVVLSAGARSIEMTLVKEKGFWATVVDPAGVPIAAAEIEVQGTDPLGIGARCDASGRARVGRLGPPPWIVFARAPGYEEVSRRDVTDGTEVRIVLRRLGSILVHVEGADGKPVRDARVRIAGASLWPAREGRTGERGMVKLAGLFEGSYALRAVSGAFVSPIEYGVIVATGEDKELTLKLAPGRSISIRVTDGDEEDARGLPGARVVLAESGLSPFPFEGVTGGDGRIVLGPISPGGASVSARADGFVSRTIAVQAEVDVKVALVRAGTLTGRIVDARGFAVGGATLTVIGTSFDGAPIDDDPTRTSFRDAQFTSQLQGPAALIAKGELGVVPGPVPPIPHGAPAFVLPGKTQVSLAEPWVSRSDGSFRINPVSPGRVRVLVRHPEHVEATSDVVTLKPGGETDVTIVLHEGGALEGRVLDVDGRPAPGIRINVAAVSGSLERTTRTATDGTFAFASLPESVTVSLFIDETSLSADLRTQVEIPEGKKREITLTLPSPRPDVAVHVEDDRGYPITTAQIGAVSLDPASPLRATVFTSDRGDATLSKMGDLSLRIEVSAPHFAPKIVSQNTNVHDAIRVVLGPESSLSGTLRADRGGTPIANAEITLYTDAGARKLASDAEGAFSATGLAPGQARLRVRASGYASDERSIVLTAQPTLLAPIDLKTEAIVEGTVVDGRGDPVQGARIAKDRVPTVLAVSATPPGVAITDSKGRFKLVELPEGLISLEAYAPDIGHGRIDIKTSAGRSTDVRITVSSDGTQSHVAPSSGSVAITLGEISATHEVVVATVADGSEAARAGVMPDDTIEEVDGVAVHTMEEARTKLNGPLADDVVLKIKRGQRILTLRIPREPVRR